jgi:hypothetical protein
MKLTLVLLMNLFSIHLTMAQNADTESPYRRENSRIYFELKNFIQNPLNCNSTKTNYQVYGKVFYYDRVIQEMLQHIKNNFDDNCLEIFIRSYIQTKGGLAEHSNLDQYELTLKKVFESNIKNLTSFFYKLGTSFQNAFHPEQVTSEQISIDEYFKQAEEFSSCRQLGNGESKVVKGNVIGIREGTHYLIEKTGSTTYKATLAIDFNDRNPNLNMNKAQMLTKVRECLNVSQTYFRSPIGESLQVNIITPAELLKLPKEKQPRIKKINIWPAGTYTPAHDTFPVDINCSEIVHEFLHHLGLVDEYRDYEQVVVNAQTGKLIPAHANILELLRNGSAIYQDRFMCRVISQTNSIMNNNRAVFDDMVSRKVTCECQTDECLKIINHPSDKVRDLVIGNIWQDLYHSSRDHICKSKLVNTYKSVELDDIKDLVTHQIINESENEIEFAHSILVKQEDKKYSAHEYNYQCACSSKSECLVLEKLRLRLKHEMVQYPEQCPIEGSKVVSKNYLPYDAKISHGVSSKNNQYIMSSASLRQDRSLLLPAHFERIIQGTCKKYAKSYTACAKNAYLENTGLTCPFKPSSCEDHSQWLQSIE